MLSLVSCFMQSGGFQVVGLVPDKMLISDREPLHQTSNITRQVIMLGG
jgi:hypothetical protein